MKKYLVILAIIFPLVTFAQTTSSTTDLQALINQLQAQIQSLQAQVVNLQAQIQSVKTELAFSRALAQGSSGDDVRQLQEFLKILPDIYPGGLVTGYFGPLTEAAVKRFQEQNGIESVGIVGPITQAKFKEFSTGASISHNAPNISTTPNSPSVVSTSFEIVSTTISTTTTTTAAATAVISSTTSALIIPVTSIGGGGNSGSGSSAPTPASNSTQASTTTSTTATSTTASSTVSDTTSPSVPTDLSASAISTSQINLSWTNSTDNIGVVGYRIYRDGAQITTTSPTSTLYSDMNLQASTIYAYTVAAYDLAGNISAQSNQASATTQANPVVLSTYPDCDQTVKNVPGDYSSIQAAINASNPGDTIKVAAGTYGENLTMKNGICLEGAGIDQTIITKSGAPGITIDNVSYAIIKNLSVKNSGCQPGLCGGGGDGGGIRITSSNNIMLDYCRLTGNSVVNGGGMIVEGTTNLTVSHCLVDNNHAANIGGGIVMESDSAATFTNTTVANNTAGGINGGIGGFSFYGASLNISNSILWGNSGPLCCGQVGSTNFAASVSGHNISYSDIGGWSGGTNNIDIDPQFVSTTDYHLQASSSAKDMGVYPSVGTSLFLKNTTSLLANLLESLRYLTPMLQKLQGLLR